MRPHLLAASALASALALAACGGSPSAARETTPNQPRASAGPIAPSEGALNGPPDAIARPVEPGATEPAGPDGEIISVVRGFRPDPIIRRGTLGGPRPADTMDPECRGQIASAPSYLLKLDAPVTDLRILVAGHADATLVVQLADGRMLCDDDSEGLNPIIAGPWPAGRHRVWVGAYSESGNGEPYTIAFTAQSTLSTMSLDGMTPTP